MSINSEYPVKMLKDSNGDPFIPYGGSLNVSIPVDSIIAFDGDSEDIPDGFEEVTLDVTADIVAFDNSYLELNADNVQDAIDEFGYEVIGGFNSVESRLGEVWEEIDNINNILGSVSTLLDNIIGEEI